MNDQEPTGDELSDEQVKVLIVLTICSASLSVMGSTAIVFKILRDWILNRCTTPYDRIVLGLSTFDILASISFTIDRFLQPSETSPSPWSFGNPATCQISGFITQLVVPWATWYNCILSYYFHFTVLSQVRLNNFVREYEPWMHLSGIYFLITAIIGYSGGWYDEQLLVGGCWVTDSLIKWIFGGITLMFTYFSMVVNYCVIYSVLRLSLRSEDVSGPEFVQEKLKREAMTMMLLYIAFFFVTVSPHFLVHLLETYFGYGYYNAGKIYPLMILQVTTLPLQGFFNFFIYTKPMYTRFRAANPNKPMYFVIHQALFNPDVPTLTFSSNEQSAPNATSEGDVGNPNQASFHCSFLSNAFEDGSVLS